MVEQRKCFCAAGYTLDGFDCYSIVSSAVAWCYCVQKVTEGAELIFEFRFLAYSR